MVRTREYKAQLFLCSVEYVLIPYAAFIIANIEDLFLLLLFVYIDLRHMNIQ